MQRAKKLEGVNFDALRFFIIFGQGAITGQS